MHLWVLGPNYLASSFKILWTGEFLYPLVLCLAKYSILAFYRRIFASTIKIPVYIIAGFVTAWGISFVGVLLLPVYSTTTRANPGRISRFWSPFFSANQSRASGITMCLPYAQCQIMRSSSAWRYPTSSQMQLYLHCLCHVCFPAASYCHLITIKHLLIEGIVIVIFRLHRTQSQRVGLVGTFMLGSL